MEAEAQNWWAAQLLGGPPTCGRWFVALASSLWRLVKSFQVARDSLRVETSAAIYVERRPEVALTFSLRSHCSLPFNLC
jgi:hypothetical protein